MKGEIEIACFDKGLFFSAKGDLATYAYIGFSTK
jgi:hypothetical protein